MASPAPFSRPLSAFFPVFGMNKEIFYAGIHVLNNYT